MSGQMVTTESVSTLALTATRSVETIWAGFVKPRMPEETASTESGDDSLALWVGMRSTVESNYSKFIEP